MIGRVRSVKPNRGVWASIYFMPLGNQMRETTRFRIGGKRAAVGKRENGAAA
jgi:hypothetical protein